jgi:hypothetical protein
MKDFRHFAVAVIASIVLSAPLAAETPAAFDIASRDLVRELELSFVGAGSLKWFGLNIYDAQLWASAGSLVNEPGADAVLLSIRYGRRLTADAISKRTEKEWRRMGIGTEDDRQAWIAELKRVLPDVAQDDVLSSVVLADGTTSFYRADELLGSVQGASFGQAFLSIWLDPRTSAKKLRTALLTRAEDSDRKIMIAGNRIQR